MERSEIMARVRGSDTTPERVVRSLVHQLGYRFRKHVAKLPGKPDLVISRLSKVVFIHGCFWHQHRCKRGQRIPATNRAYWEQKLRRNVERDRRNRRKLRQLGWDVLTVWECQTRDREKLESVLIDFLEA